MHWELPVQLREQAKLLRPFLDVLPEDGRLCLLFEELRAGRPRDRPAEVPDALELQQAWRQSAFATARTSGFVVAASRVHRCLQPQLYAQSSLLRSVFDMLAKDDFAAFCLRSCSPGINPHDPPQFQTPWTCARVGAGPAPPAPPAPSPAQPGCAAASENCHDNPVCCDSSMACYEKDDWYARCRASCTPGIQKSDPWRFRTPWACSRLTPGPAAPPNPLLQLPSSADVLTFHMYRAQGPTAYPPENVNAGNLAGVMWYLQHEVVSGDYGEGNKFGITRILRLKLQTKAPQPLADKGMNFGVRVAFDSGRCTGPSCELSWNNYGYNVGCNNLGDYPYPKYSTHYQGGIWYSLPGPCPSTEYQDKTAECKLQEPGGLCAGTPTGTGNCTWSYEDAGEISLEELYKGTDHSSFWENPHNDAANEERVQAAKAVFASKYGDELTDPACDFNFTGFYA
eukprot:CAMPEP_0115085886 /NCGR_PEP_ID=MMETSP0227-20121206/22222_1 /TAXON_ID=89957 /ORGANISM="Polarella glacialis, Strain CCMP 1383" /LENGTH=453 /DNA_ID=CAMNT_0002475169 /DNA_START=218 /DNA_END=1580 /DNA_ORIENTATION=-